MNKVDSAVRKFDYSTSDKGSGSFFTVESLGNMLPEIVGQLYQQRMIAKLPKLLGMDKAASREAAEFVNKNSKTYLSKYGITLEEAIKTNKIDPVFFEEYLTGINSVTKLANERSRKLAENGSKLYMAFTQSSDMYDTFKQNGYSDLGTAVGMMGALYGFHRIFASSLGDVALSGLGLDDTNKLVKALSADMIAKTGTKESLEAAAKAGSSKFIKAVNKFGNTMQKNFVKILDNKEGVLANMVKESLEEVSEEALQDAIYFGMEKLD